MLLSTPRAGGAGLVVVAAAPGIADELLAALQRFNGLAPIPD
ncbi:extragenic suppressor protein SUHB [Mycobacterium tuberculosis]|uniref:Extragenic suppressor protein SUHB n=1 Tax=Mycobacterium tuberculosis TaxID=1773 RepID=A0A654TVA8_MYCTX|nr:extragenic suppressor protein SUHB [Mycobacterium tuberculosis]